MLWRSLMRRAILLCLASSIAIAVSAQESRRETRGTHTFRIEPSLSQRLGEQLQSVLRRDEVRDSEHGLAEALDDTVESSDFSPRTAWDLTALRQGIDVRHYPDMTLRPIRAINSRLPDPTTAGTGAMASSTFYLDNVEAIQDFESDSAGLDLGFGNDTVSVSFDFQSRNMRGSSHTTRHTYLVIRFEDSQQIPLSDPTLTADAADLWEANREAFFDSFGTHFVSQVQLNARLFVVLKFSSESRRALGQFARSAGLGASVGPWSAGVSGSLTNAYKEYKGSVRIEGSVYATGEARHGLPDLDLFPSGTDQDIDLSAIDAIREQYRTNLAASRAGLRVTSYRITPFAELDSSYDQVAQTTIAVAMQELEYIQQVRHDVQLLTDFSDYWGAVFPAGTINQINTDHAQLVEALTDLLASGSATAVEDVIEAIDAWRTHSASYAWPSAPAGPSVKVHGAGPFQVDVRVKKGRALPVSASFFSTTVTPAADSTPASTEVEGNPLSQFSAPTDDPVTTDYRIYHFEAIDPPAENKDQWIEVRDGVGRSFYFLIGTAVSGRRTLPMPDFEVMIEDN